MSKRILITGASGFIGSFLVEEGLRDGYEVYAGIRAGSRRDFLRNEAIRFFHLDLSSPQALERQLKLFDRSEGGFDYVIHNAGITRARKKEDFQLVNDRYTQNLVDALIAVGKLPEKFLFISSLATCGPGDPVDYRPIRPSDTDHPISAYAKSKLAAEKYIRSLPGFPYIIVRPTAVYGPRDKDFLAYFRILGKGIEPYMGRHRQMLSLIYVKDLSRAVFKILSSGRLHASYLVSDGTAYTKEDLGSAIRMILDRQTIKIRLPLAPIRASLFCMEKIYSLLGRVPFLHREKLKEMTAPNWLCDSCELWQELGIHPAYTLEAGLLETANWYKEKGWLH